MFALSYELLQYGILMNTAVRASQAGLISDRTRWTEGGLPLVPFLCFLIATALGLYALSFLRTMPWLNEARTGHERRRCRGHP